MRMVCVPAQVFARITASRREQSAPEHTPSLVSAVLVTVISASHGTGVPPQPTIRANKKIAKQGIYRAIGFRTGLMAFLLCAGSGTNGKAICVGRVILYLRVGKCGIPAGWLWIPACRERLSPYLGLYSQR